MSMPGVSAGGDTLIDDVIRILLEEAELESLKEIRELNNHWNDLSIKELCKRASKGNLSQIKCTSEEMQEKFKRDTAENPGIFQSFQLKVPESLNSINTEFLSKYHPAFLHLDISRDLRTDDHSIYLRNILSWVAPSLRRLVIQTGYSNIDTSALAFPCKPETPNQLVFQHLGTLLISTRSLDIWNFLLDKNGEVDPTPNLTTLEFDSKNDLAPVFHPDSAISSRWYQLTQMKLTQTNRNENAENRINTDILLKLGVGGMRLKALDLKVRYDIANWSRTCSNMSQFFETQSSSLHILKFEIFEVDAVDVSTRIRLPVFKELHLLHLRVKYHNLPMDLQVVPSPFIMDQLPLHCPKLRDLEVSKVLLPKLYPQDVTLVKPLFLKNLAIIGRFDGNENYEGWKEYLETRFPSVENFRCWSALVQGMELPWAESLKYLHIYSINGPIRLSHLANLQRLIVSQSGYYIPVEFLTYFDDAQPLNLTSITFILSKMVSERSKVAIARYLPFNLEWKLKKRHHR